MGYTSAELINVIQAVGFTVGGVVVVVGGVVVKIIAARLKRVEKDVQVLVPVITETLAKAKVIEGHVNSEKMAGEGREKTKDAIILMLREQLAKNDQIAALLAAKVPVPIQVINGPLPKAHDSPRASSEESLKRIDVSTEQTARNTERTEAVVQDLKNQS